MLSSDVLIFPGLDYHFHRGEIYYTTDNRTLSRVGVNLTNDNSLSVRTGAC